MAGWMDGQIDRYALYLSRTVAEPVITVTGIRIYYAEDK